MAMGLLSKLYYTSVVIANDLKHIHTHAYGKKFDRIHNICNEYYEKMSEESDELVELALEYNEPVQNASDAASILKYKPANQSVYYWEEAMQKVYDILNIYINELETALTKTPAFDSDVENLLQEYLRYWKKENNYKNKARMEENF